MEVLKGGFKAILDDLLRSKLENVCGRDWVHEKMESWRTGASRALIVIGPPGCGKTTIMAQLILGNKTCSKWIAAYHCCVSSLKSTLSPLEFVTNCIAMFRNTFPDLSVEETNNKADPIALMTSLLQGLNKLTIEENFVFAIDALDESLGYKGPMNIIDLLINCRTIFPTWLKLVCTSRNETELSPMENAFEYEQIDVAEESNAIDARLFTETMLTKFKLTDPSGQLMEAILEKSGGLLLFIQQLFPMDGSISQEEFKAKLQDTPRGLKGLYENYFRRTFAVPHGKALSDAHPHIYKFLQILVAAREPLHKDVFLAVSALDETSFKNSTRQLKQFLNVHVKSDDKSEEISIFHKFFTDWLTSSDPEFFVSSEESHKLFSQYGWELFKSKRLVDPSLANTPVVQYLLRHLLHHLSEKEKIVELFADLSFLHAEIASIGVECLLNVFTFADSNPSVSVIKQGLQSLSQIPDLGDRSTLAAQLVGALKSYDTISGVKKLVDDCLSETSHPGLIPQTSFLSKIESPFLFYSGHSARVQCVEFFNNGKNFVSGAENTLKVWSTSHTLCLAELVTEESSVWCVAGSNDGKLIISG